MMPITLFLGHTCFSVLKYSGVGQLDPPTVNTKSVSYTHLVPALMSFGHEQATAANLMMISGALALVCSLAGGMVDEKLGTRHAMTVCGIAGACLLYTSRCV